MWAEKNNSCHYIGDVEFYRCTKQHCNDTGKSVVDDDATPHKGVFNILFDCYYCLKVVGKFQGGKNK